MTTDQGRIQWLSRFLFLQKLQSAPDSLTGAIISSSCLPASVPPLISSKPYNTQSPLTHVTVRATKCQCNGQSFEILGTALLQSENLFSDVSVKYLKIIINVATLTSAVVSSKIQHVGVQNDKNGITILVVTQCLFVWFL